MPMRLVLALLLLAGPAAAAQDGAPGPDPGSARPVDAVRATVQALFDGMRAADSSAVRATFHPQMRLYSVAREGERHVLHEGSVPDFLKAVADAPVTYDERVADVEVRIDDGLATAWMAYRFYAGDRFSHCGVNAMQLVQDANGWRILQIVDTRRTGCE